MIKWTEAAKAYQYWAERGEYIRADAIRVLIVHALPVAERKAYALIKSKQGIRTADLGRELGLSNQHAWDVCHNLERMYLVRNNFASGSRTWYITRELPQHKEG